MAGEFDEYFCFAVENITIGISLQVVDRVISAVAVNRLPNSPGIVHGLIDFHGKIIPVINLRYRLALREKGITPDQVFVLVNTPLRKLAFAADSASGVISIPPREVITPAAVDRGIEATGIYRADDGLIFIYDTEQFLSSDDVIQIEKATAPLTNLSAK